MHVKKIFLTAFHSLTLQVRLVPLRHLSRTRSLYWSSAAEFVWEFGSTKFENRSTQKNHTTRGQKTRDTFLFQNGLFTIQHSDDQLPKTGSALVIAQMLKFKLLEGLLLSSFTWKFDSRFLGPTLPFLNHDISNFLLVRYENDPTTAPFKDSLYPSSVRCRSLQNNSVSSYQSHLHNPP